MFAVKKLLLFQNSRTATHTEWSKYHVLYDLLYFKFVADIPANTTIVNQSYFNIETTLALVRYLRRHSKQGFYSDDLDIPGSHNRSSCFGDMWLYCPALWEPSPQLSLAASSSADLLRNLKQDKTTFNLPATKI